MVKIGFLCLTKEYREKDEEMKGKGQKRTKANKDGRRDRKKDKEGQRRTKRGKMDKVEQRERD